MVWDRAVAPVRDNSNGNKSKRTLERSDDSSDVEGRQNHVSPDASAFSVGSQRPRFYVSARLGTSHSTSPSHRSDSEAPAFELSDAATFSLLDHQRRARPRLQDLEMT